MIEPENHFDIILAYEPENQLSAIATREWLELEQVRVLMTSFPFGQTDGVPTMSQVHHEGMVALVLLGENGNTMDLERVLMPLIERARADWRPFLYACRVTHLSRVEDAQDFPVHWLRLEGSFRALAQSMVQELVGRGWKRPVKPSRKPNPSPSTPRGGNQTIKGNRNIQIGGDLNTGSGFTLNT